MCRGTGLSGHACWRYWGEINAMHQFCEAKQLGPALRAQAWTGTYQRGYDALNGPIILPLLGS